MYRLVILLFIVAPFSGYAQIGSVPKKVTNKTLNKVSGKAENQIDRAIDNVLNGKEDKEEKPAPATPEPKAKKEVTETKTETPVAPVRDTGIRSYVKYDFIPGEKIIYNNDFTTDAMGEMPVGWNSNGTGAVVTLSGLNGNWVQLHQNSVYLTDNKDSLSENFTVEFDLVLRRTNPKAPFPVLAFGVLASGDHTPTANELLKEYINTFAAELKIQPYDNNASHMHYSSWGERRKYLTTDVKKYGELENYFNKVIHVAMQVQKERLRIWFNETKMYDLPKAIAPQTIINQLYFDVKRYGGPDAEVGYAIGNIRIAKGLPDTRHRLVEEGKFSTTGILFDINSASIKRESYGVLKEISDVLKQFPDIKVKIAGHTDSDGSDVANLELSKKRAASVKEALVLDFGIEKARIETDGKGESNPVGDNKTKAGKAQNRRVEFEKI